MLTTHSNHTMPLIHDPTSAPPRDIDGLPAPRLREPARPPETPLEIDSVPPAIDTERRP